MLKIFTLSVLFVFGLNKISVLYGETLTFTNYREMQLNMIKIINTAKTRIWLTSDYFTDNEIATALFVANYKNIDVKIMVSAEKANAHMSRVRFFKNNKIPIFQRPASFVPISPMLCLVDNTLFLSNRSLNFLEETHSIQLVVGDEQIRALFESSFTEALKNPIDPYYKQPALKYHGNLYGGKQKYYVPQQRYDENSSHPTQKLGRSPFKTDLHDDTFIYSLTKEERPSYIPSHLPSTTLSGEGKSPKREKTPRKKRKSSNDWH